MTKWDAFGVFLNREGYLRSFASETLAEDFVYYVAFKPFVQYRKHLTTYAHSLRFPETQVSQNTKLLGLMLQSDNDFILKLYLSAVVLVVLVIISGVLMIANSLHTMVARRTDFSLCSGVLEPVPNRLCAMSVWKLCAGAGSPFLSDLGFPWL